MSAPVIWIIIPFASAVIFWFLQEKRGLVRYTAAGLCFLISLIAMFQNINSALRIGPLAINVPSTMTVLGRSFILDNADRIFLVIIYASLVIWYLASGHVETSAKFIPLSLAIVALLTAGLAVQPFLYSAILIELAVIISLPLLISRGTPVGKGVVRYLIFQSLAMPFILLAGWILSGVETSFSDLNQLYIAALFLGLGFAFWLGIFPFHFWIPEFSSENDPFINGFILSAFPLAFILIMLNYISGLTWLRDTVFLMPALRISGTLMIATGGIWAAAQTNLRRIFGHIVILETGFLLVCISLRDDLGTQLFYYAILARALELALMTLVLRLLQKDNVDMTVAGMQGMIKKYPVAISALVIALFSSAGLPLLASFPIRTVLFTQFTSTPGVLAWMLIGSGAVLLVAGNLLRTAMHNGQTKWTVQESRTQILFLVLGVIFLLLIGTFPRTFLEGIWSTLSGFLTM